MHPRERCLALAELLFKRKEQLPLPLIDEAKRLNISLDRFIVTEEEKTKPTIKESPHDSES